MFESGCLPIAVISDVFLGWTLDCCDSFGVPRIVTYGTSRLSQALLVKTGIHIEHILGLFPEDVIHFPDFPTPFPVKRADFVHMKHDPRGSEMFSLIEEIREADLNSWGVIVNSFEDYYPYIDWLDKLEVGLGSVIYVSFGSEAKVSEEQLEEIAFGLEEAAQPFVWVVKSKTWEAPPGWE